MDNVTDIQDLANENKTKPFPVIFFDDVYQPFFDEIVMIKPIDIGLDFTGRLKNLSCYVYAYGRQLFLGLNCLNDYYEYQDLSELKQMIRRLKDLAFTDFSFLSRASYLKFEDNDNPDKQIIVLKDHINLTSYNPLIGANDDSYGVRFPDMSEAYDSNRRLTLINDLKQKGYTPQEEVALMMYEGQEEVYPVNNPAKIRMSSVGAEVIVANHSHLSCLAVALTGDMTFDYRTSEKMHRFCHIIEALSKKS